MRYHPARTSPSSRLRMVFDDAVIMLNLASGATYGDVAALWDDKANGCDRATIAIAVTMDPGMPLPSSWMYPSNSGAALCGAPSLRDPVIHFRTSRAEAMRQFV